MSVRKQPTDCLPFQLRELLSVGDMTLKTSANRTQVEREV